MEATEELPSNSQSNFLYNLQFKVINLQCNGKLKGNYQGESLIEFFKCLPSDKYAQLK